MQCTEPYCDGNLYPTGNFNEYRCDKCKRKKYVEFENGRAFAGVS